MIWPDESVTNKLLLVSCVERHETTYGAYVTEKERSDKLRQLNCNPRILSRRKIEVLIAGGPNPNSHNDSYREPNRRKKKKMGNMEYTNRTKQNNTHIQTYLQIEEMNQILSE